MAYSEDYTDAYQGAAVQTSDLGASVGVLSGTVPSEEWLAVSVGQVLAHIRLKAPCRRDEWLTPEDLPADVWSVLVAALARLQRNPAGYRTEQIGEYSYTFAGGGVGSSLLTDAEISIVTTAADCASNTGSAYSTRTTPTGVLADQTYLDARLALLAANRKRGCH